MLPPIDVHDLLGQPGTSRRHDVLGTIEGLETELVTVPEDAPLGGSLLLESVVEGILVSGSITGTWLVCKAMNKLSPPSIIMRSPIGCRRPYRISSIFAARARRPNNFTAWILRYGRRLNTPGSACSPVDWLSAACVSSS